MSRICKENINTSFFHIMVQGINKEYIFDTEEDINEYMKIMQDTKEKIEITILAYCIMNNHAHILFHEQNVENLTKYMHRVNLLYAKYYNKKYNRVGYVFRDRYKTQPIYSEKHLHSCVRYIHNNPVKANICNEANKYKYSSCYYNVFYTDTELERNIKANMYIQESNPEEDKKFILMEHDIDKKQLANDIIKKFMIENKTTKEEFCQNEKLIGLAVRRLKDENGISYRIIEEITGINRKRLNRIAKQ